jgi:hypothetical protein
VHVTAHVFAKAVIDGLMAIIDARSFLRCAAFIRVNEGRAV